MGVVVKQSFISSALTYLGATIAFFNVLWLYPKSFGEDMAAFGAFRVILDTSILLVPFAQMGISTTLIKFYPNFKESRHKLSTMLNTSLLAGSISFLLFALVFSASDDLIIDYFSKKSVQILPYVKFTLVLIFILSMSGILEAYSRTMLKIVVPNFIKEVLIRILSGGLVALYYKEYIDLDGLFLGLVGVYAVALLVIIAYLIYLKQFSLHLDFSIFDRKLVRSIINFCLVAILSSGSTLIVMKIDSIMVAGALGEDKNPIYTVAFFIATVIELPRRSISQIMGPLLSTKFKEGQINEVKSLYKKSSINLFIIGLLLFIGIISNLDSLYFMIPNYELYHTGKIVVLIIGVSKLIDMVTGVNSEIITMSQYYRFNIIAITLLAIFTIATNSILIPRFGFSGAAFASLLSIFIFNFTKLIFLYKKFKMQPFTFNTLKVLAVGILIYLMVQLIPRNANPVIDIIIRTLVITPIYVVAILKLKVSKEANDLFDEFYGRFSKRI